MPAFFSLPTLSFQLSLQFLLFLVHLFLYLLTLEHLKNSGEENELPQKNEEKRSYNEKDFYLSLVPIRRNENKKKKKREVEFWTL